MDLLFVINNYTIYIHQPFHNGDLREVSWNHTTTRFNCSPCRTLNCSCNVFTTLHWSKAEVSCECLYAFNQQQKRWASIVYLPAVNQEKSLEWLNTFINNPLPQRNSHGQLLMKNNMTSCLVCGGQKNKQFWICV